MINRWKVTLFTGRGVGLKIPLDNVRTFGAMHGDAWCARVKLKCWNITS